MALVSRIDHVACAVPDLAAARPRWEDRLGGRLWSWSRPDRGFRSQQFVYRGGGRLELIAPGTDPDGFVQRFLDRFGSRPHHVTLKVPALRSAIAELTDAGLDVVDVYEEGEWWHEGFLRPSQVGGLIVQVAWSGKSDDDWQDYLGHTPEEPPGDGAVFVGLRLRDPDLAAAAARWKLLGADVTEVDGELDCRWDEAPLTVRIEEGGPAGPVALRFADAPTLGDDPVRGGPVEAVKTAKG